MLCDFLLADRKGFFFPGLVDLRHTQIVLRRKADERTQRLHHVAFRNLVIALGAVGQLQPAGGLDDLRIAGMDRDAVRVKIVFLPAIFKFYSDYFCQWLILASSQPRPAP